MRIPGKDTAWAQARGYREQWGVESKLMAGVAPVEVGQVQLMDSLEHQLELGPGGLGEMPPSPLFFPGLQAQDTTKQTDPLATPVLRSEFHMAEPASWRGSVGRYGLCVLLARVNTSRLHLPAEAPGRGRPGPSGPWGL